MTATPKAIAKPILAPKESPVTYTLLFGIAGCEYPAVPAEVDVAVTVEAGTAVVMVVTPPFVNVLVNVLCVDDAADPEVVTAAPPIWLAGVAMRDAGTC